MSELQFADSIETASWYSPSLYPGQLAEVLAQVEHLRCMVSRLLVDNGASETCRDIPPEVPKQLRLIAMRALGYSIAFSDEKLQAACKNAVDKLRSKFVDITPECGWNDAEQETWRALRMRMLNLAEKPIDCLEGYAYQTMQSLIRRWRKKGGRKKPLSVIPGGEELITIPENDSDHEGSFDREAFCKYLDAQPQPNPSLAMSKVFRAFTAECNTRAKVAAKLGVTKTELGKQINAIRTYRKQWEG
jgi:hypothetical protein